MTGRRRRIAVHKAITDAGELGLCAIELAGGVVVGCYEIDGELAYTEWLGGRHKDRRTWRVESILQRKTNRIRIWIE